MHAAHATVPGIDHRRVHVNGTELHYALAGTEGTPVVLVHGFPESWWVFHKVMPRLAEHHRVVAVDLRASATSALADRDHDSATAAQDLGALIAHLDLGPVHLVGQDISGPTTFRVAAARPELACRATRRSRPGSPASAWRCSPTRRTGGAWHIGALARARHPRASARRPGACVLV